jgi:hypothetical protein
MHIRLTVSPGPFIGSQGDLSVIIDEFTKTILSEKIPSKSSERHLR